MFWRPTQKKSHRDDVLEKINQNWSQGQLPAVIQSPGLSQTVSNSQRSVVKQQRPQTCGNAGFWECHLFFNHLPISSSSVFTVGRFDYQFYFSRNSPALPFASVCLPRLRLYCTNFKIFWCYFSWWRGCQVFPVRPIQLVLSSRQWHHGCPTTPPSPWSMRCPSPSVTYGCQGDVAAAWHVRSVSPAGSCYPSLQPRICRDTAFVWSSVCGYIHCMIQYARFPSQCVT